MSVRGLTAGSRFACGQRDDLSRDLLPPHSSLRHLQCRDLPLDLGVRRHRLHACIILGGEGLGCGDDHAFQGLLTRWSWRGQGQRRWGRPSEGVMGGMVACADLAHLRNGQRVVCRASCWCGRSRVGQGHAKGIMFITVEDETGVANLIVWPDRFIRQCALHRVM